MADTEAKATNGPMDAEKLPWDPDDPETQRQMRRPADIDQDVKEMDRRKRVEMILNSAVFREELERIIESQLKEGYNPASLLALQQISELILPHSQFSGASMSRGSSQPIADIRGVESLNYAKGEKILRCKLASLYRLVDLLGWTQSIFNHITVRLSQDQEHFLINAYGLLYHEITASNLVKVDIQGNILDPGTTALGINPAGYTLHSAIHAARPDIRCVIHVHVPNIITVSSCQYGLLPLSQESMILGEVTYHDYNGLLVDAAERESLARDLGPTCKTMLLRNHGAICCGETVEEAFLNIYHLALACDTQVKMLPMGLENMIQISDGVVQRFRAQIATFETQRDANKADPKPKDRPRKVKSSDLLFDSYMRMLDNAGYRTGHIYRTHVTRSEAPRTKNDVEIPPASSAYTHIFDEDDLVKFSPLKKILDSRKAQDKTRWLNSPNVYQKVEVLETGTTDPKKITKWVAEGSPTHGTSIKLEGAHQFTIPPVDPQEFKRKQKELKENRMQSKVTAGPQSHILEGATWEEAKMMQDATTSGTGDQVVIVGAASKGIIQREFQHNATVYKTPYAKNPFDSMTNEDLEEYKRVVEKKQKGDTDDEVDAERSTITYETSVTSLKLTEDELTPVAEVRSLPQSPTSPLSDEEVRRKSRPIKPPPVGPKPQKSLKPPPSPKIVISHAKLRRSMRSPNDSSDVRIVRSETPRIQKPAREFVPTSPVFRRQFSRASSRGETTVNGDDVKEGIRSAESGENMSAASRSSKEGSPTKEAPGLSPKKEKKKKKGLRTPSFLKKKKDKKKKDEVEESK